jgi:hypothetical protein
MPWEVGILDLDKVRGQDGGRRKTAYKPCHGVAMAMYSGACQEEDAIQPMLDFLHMIAAQTCIEYMRSRNSLKIYNRHVKGRVSDRYRKARLTASTLEGPRA